MIAQGDREQVIGTYRARARNYDLAANLYYLIGFRQWAYRKKAVRALNLQRGDTVVEIGCGTGLNFSLLQEAVGPEGRIIGVDLTDAMLAQARARVEREGWTNVELVHSDALLFEFPEGVDGILSTLAISLIPECDQVIRNGSEALAPGKRWVVLDLKMPSRWPARLALVILPLVRPFAVTREVIERRPWERLWEAMNETLVNTMWEELYLGFAFIASGERAGSDPAGG